MRRTGFRSRLAAGAVAFATAVAATAPFAAAFAGTQSPPKPRSHQTGPQLAVPGGTSGRSLSRRLSRSGGVLHPPPLSGNSMPVIPPPGTPGGNPNVEPK